MVQENLTNLVMLVLGTVLILAVVQKVFGKEDYVNYDVLHADYGKVKDASKTMKFDHQAIDQNNAEAQRADVREQEKEAYKQLNEFEEAKPEDLLPKDEESSEWAKVNPMGKGSLEFKNFIEAGYHYGVDTQTSSLRNANLQLRSEPANPQVPVSIWQNSTILPSDAANRKALEIGKDF